MSLFRKDFEARIKESINYFNSLGREKQSFIVSNLVMLDDDDGEKLSALLSGIRNDISNYDQTTISNKLFELGLEKTYAVLFVQNIIEQTPTLEYELKELAKLSDDDFKDNFPKCMTNIWVERKPTKQISEEQELSMSQIQIIADVTRTLMNEIVRSSLSEKKVTELCKTSDFSDSKLEVLLNTIRINSEYWRKFVMFSNTQDAFFSLQNIEQQNDMILRTLQEILKILKGKDAGDNMHFQ